MAHTASAVAVIGLMTRSMEFAKRFPFEKRSGLAGLFRVPESVRKALNAAANGLHAGRRRFAGRTEWGKIARYRSRLEVRHRTCAKLVIEAAPVTLGDR